MPEYTIELIAVGCGDLFILFRITRKHRMKTYLVTYPIAGHATFEVEAENEIEAKQLAEAKDLTSDDVDVTWESLQQFNRGNVCYCPAPWETEIEEI